MLSKCFQKIKFISSFKFILYILTFYNFEYLLKILFKYTSQEDLNYILIIASQAGNKNIVDLLLDKYTFDKNKCIIVALSSACKNNHTFIIEKLLNFNILADNIVNYRVNDIVKNIIINSNIEMLKRLLSYPIDDEICNLILAQACINNKLHIVKLLIDDYLIDPSYWDTAIWHASTHGHYKIVKKLFSYHGVNNESSNKQIFKEVCIKGYSNIVKLFLKKAKFDKTFNINDYVVLASQNNQFELIPLLLADSRNKALTEGLSGAR